MEVHAHSHLASGETHTARKKWTHYFWEFLMLFLAVFCGFLAEYQLEHKIEKERGKQFIESFYEDLKTDTARISWYINYDDEKLSVLVNLGNCYDTLLISMKSSSCLLDIIKHSSINRPFIRTNRTLQQLANAAGFRLLKKEDADSILSYDKDVNNFQDFQATVFQDAQNNVRSTSSLLINFKANSQMFQPRTGELITELSKENVTAPLLFTNDKNLLNKYFNDLQLYYRVIYTHKRILPELKGKQAQLIDYFKNKNHFE